MQSNIDIVVGGQYGSEGKGAITALLHKINNYHSSVRVGGSNAGHTVRIDGNKYINQVVPTPCMIDNDVYGFIGSDSFFKKEELLKEIQKVEEKFGDNNIKVDPFAGIITQEDIKRERDRDLGKSIGSTEHGVGSAKVSQIWRDGSFKLAKNVDEINQYISDERINIKIIENCKKRKSSIIEGTQGTFLSMNHSGYYPFSTSRDCIASSFVSSVGLPINIVRDVWCVFRTYPIRVGGNSGETYGEEVGFEYIADKAGFDETPVEYTSVTKKKRRIFKWSWEEFKISMQMNNPDYIALTFVDYLNADDKGVTDYNELSNESKSFLKKLEIESKKYNSSVGIIKTGESPNSYIDTRKIDLI